MKIFSAQYSKFWVALLGAAATIAVTIWPAWSSQIQAAVGALGTVITALLVAAVPNAP